MGASARENNISLIAPMQNIIRYEYEAEEIQKAVENNIKQQNKMKISREELKSAGKYRNLVEKKYRLIIPLEKKKYLFKRKIHPE